MSNNIDKNILLPIGELVLSGSDIGDSLNGRLKLIDDNFKAIASAEYLKGAKGDSISIETINLDSDTSLYEEIRNCIKGESGGNSLNGFNGDSWDANLVGKKINLICRVESDGTKTPISSLPFIFKDARFSNLSNLSSTQKNELAGLENKSCVVYYNGDANKFEVLHIFPTIYYDPVQKQFCWKINDEETDLMAQGIQGDTGKNGIGMALAAGNIDTDTNVITITKIYTYNKNRTNQFIQWAPSTDTAADINTAISTAIEELKLSNNSLIICQCSSPGNENIYVGNLVINKSGNTFSSLQIYNPISLTEEFSEDSLKNLMNTSKAKVLYIPKDEPGRGHLISINNQDLTISNGQLNINDDGTSTYTQDVMSGKLTSNYTTTQLNGSLTADGTTTLKDTLTVNGTTTLKDTLTVNGAATLDNTLTVGGDTNLNNKLTVGGDTNLNNKLTVGGDTNLNNKLTVGDDTTLRKGMTIGTAVNIDKGEPLSTVNPYSTIDDKLLQIGTIKCNNLTAGEINVQSLNFAEGGTVKLPKDIYADNITVNETLKISNVAWNNDVVAGIESVRSISYADLADLKNHGNLVPGMKYRINDYTMTISESAESGSGISNGGGITRNNEDGESTDYANDFIGTSYSTADHKFDIIVTAVDRNTFSEDVIVTQNSNIYFNNSKLESWTVKYCFDNDTTRFPWANKDGKGVIYYMKDEYGNEAPYDFKNLLIGVDVDKLSSRINASQRGIDEGIDEVNFYNNLTAKNGSTHYFYTFTFIDGNYDIHDATIHGTTKQSFTANTIEQTSYSKALYVNVFCHLAGVDGVACVNNIIGHTSGGNYFGPYAHSNTVANYCNGNIFGKRSMQNTMGEGCSFNTLWHSSQNEISHGCCLNTLYRSDRNAFNQYCEYNALGYHNYYNELSSNCSYNKFGRDCNANVLHPRCSKNTFGDNCIKNFLGASCIDNTFDNNCQSNNLKQDCNHNKFSKNCSYNNLDGLCANNEFSTNFQWNNLGGSCGNNKFGEYCYRNTFGDDCDQNEIGNEFTHNVLGSHCSNNIFGNKVQQNTLETYCKENKIVGECYRNHFGPWCSKNILNWYCNNNKFGAHSNANELMNYCNANEFGAKCSTNKLGYESTYNTFGPACENNTLGQYCKCNTFGPQNHNNSFDNNCQNNSLGEYCRRIELKEQCKSNTFGATCTDNTLYKYCSNNKFGSSCQGNKLGEYSVENTFGINCNGNQLGVSAGNSLPTYAVPSNLSNIYNAVRNTFGDYCNYNIMGYEAKANKFGSECSFNTFGNDIIRCELGVSCKGCRIVLEKGRPNTTGYRCENMNYVKNVKFGDSCGCGQAIRGADSPGYYVDAEGKWNSYPYERHISGGKRGYRGLVFVYNPAFAGIVNPKLLHKQEYWATYPDPSGSNRFQNYVIGPEIHAALPANQHWLAVWPVESPVSGQSLKFNSTYKPFSPLGRIEVTNIVIRSIPNIYGSTPTRSIVHRLQCSV